MNFFINFELPKILNYFIYLIIIYSANKDEMAMSVYLTKKERKKLRRLNRKEVQKDEHEKIRLGLVPAPEPKGKTSFIVGDINFSKTVITVLNY